MEGSRDPRPSPSSTTGSLSRTTWRSRARRPTSASRSTSRIWRRPLSRSRTTETRSATATSGSGSFETESLPDEHRAQRARGRQADKKWRADLEEVVDVQDLGQELPPPRDEDPDAAVLDGAPLEHRHFQPHCTVPHGPHGAHLHVGERAVMKWKGIGDLRSRVGLEQNEAGACRDFVLCADSGSGLQDEQESHDQKRSPLMYERFLRLHTSTLPLILVLGACVVPPQTPSVGEKVLLAVQGAVDGELGPLIEAVGRPRPRVIDGFSFWEGEIGGSPVVVSRTEVGMVNAAIATTLLVREYSPKAIINQGTAGAADPALRVGDIVLGKATAPFGSIRTPPRKLGEGVDFSSWEILPRLLRVGEERVRFTHFDADRDLLSAP